MGGSLFDLSHYGPYRVTRRNTRQSKTSAGKRDLLILRTYGNPTTMKRTTLLLATALASSGASGADRAIATFALSYRLETLTFTDTIVIDRIHGNGEYSGYDADTGEQVWAVKNGPMLCASVVDARGLGKSYCFPYRRRFSPRAFVIDTICDDRVDFDGVIRDFCTGFPMTASMIRSRTATTAAQALSEEEVERKKRQKVMELQERLPRK